MDANLIGYGLIDYIVVYIMIIWAVYSAIKNNGEILYILPASLTFYFFIPLGGSFITPYKLVPLVYLFALLLVGRKIKITLNRWLWGVISIFLLSTTMAIVFNISFDFSQSYRTPDSRIIVQIISNINLFVIAFILRLECNTSERLFKFLNAYVITSIILCFYGVYQYIAMQVGLPFRGIIRGIESEATDAAIDVNNLIFRINSFANEPKRLSYMLGVGLILMIILYEKKHLIFPRKSAIAYYCLLILHLYCILLTYSTSIYVSLLLFIVLTLILNSFATSLKLFNKYVVLLFLTGIIAFFINYDRIMFLYELRVVEQFTELQSGKSVRIEPYVYEYFFQKPQYLLLGVGSGMYNFFLDDFFGVGVGTTSIGYNPIDTGFLAATLDYGLVGLIILILPLISFIFKQRAWVNIYILPVLLFLICNMLVLDCWEIYFAFIGCAYGVRTIRY